MTTDKPDEQGNQTGRSGKLAAIYILFGLGLVLFWQVMALRIASTSERFSLSARDFVDFEPSYPGYRVASAPVSSSPTEPNIVAYRLTSRADRNRRAFIRLAHGYNMRDCMRYRHYTVDLLDDKIVRGYSGPSARVQIWRLTDPQGEPALWISSMLRATDFTPLDLDTRSMPFPSIGVPVDPGWSPRGLSRDSLRRPIYNLRMFMRAKWNNARRDLATFLRLRRPAWASDEVLTLVSGTLASGEESVDPATRRDEILSQHLRAIEQLNLGVRRSTPPPLPRRSHASPPEGGSMAPALRRAASPPDEGVLQ